MTDLDLAHWLATLAGRDPDHPTSAGLAAAAARLRELALANHVLRTACLDEAGWMDRRAPFFRALDPTGGATNALELHAAALRQAAERGSK